MDFGTLDVDSSDTDEIIRKKAEGMLPEALRRIGVELGKVEWDIATSAGFETTPRRQREYSEQRGKEYARGAGPKEKKSALEALILDITRVRDELVEEERSKV